MPFKDLRWKRLTWYLAFGLALPWLTFLVACIRYGKVRDILHIPERLFGGGYNYFALGCLCAIPFAVVAGVAVLQGSIRKESQSCHFGVVTAAVATIILSAIYQTLLWSNMEGPHPDSLIGVGFVIIPLLITAASIVLGALAWAISAVVLQTREPAKVK